MAGRLDARQFRESRRIHVATLERAVLPGHGFSKVKGMLWYLTKQGAVRSMIFGVAEKGNLGPQVTRDFTEEWARSSSDFGAMRAHLAAQIDRTVKEITAQSYPEVRVYFDHCNTTGRDVEEFLEDCCDRCACWYCELSGA